MYKHVHKAFLKPNCNNFHFSFLSSELLVWHGIWPEVQLLSTTRFSLRSCETGVTEKGDLGLITFLSDIIDSCSWGNIVLESEERNVNYPQQMSIKKWMTVLFAFGNGIIQKFGEISGQLVTFCVLTREYLTSFLSLCNLPQVSQVKQNFNRPSPGFGNSQMQTFSLL